MTDTPAPVAQPLSAEEEQALRMDLTSPYGNAPFVARLLATLDAERQAGRIIAESLNSAVADLDAARGSSPLTTQGPRSVPSDRPASDPDNAALPGEAAHDHTPDCQCLPIRVVVDQHGHYWRDYGDHWSMCPVSTENVATTPVTEFYRLGEGGDFEATTPAGLDDDTRLVILTASPYRCCQRTTAFRAVCEEVDALRPDLWCAFCQARGRLMTRIPKAALASPEEPR